MWHKELTRYHWWVLIVASLGWLFDTMDQRIFVLSRGPAMSSLLPAGASAADVTFYSGLATAVFMAGWATGGFYFGILGDRWGRAKTMMLTILIYSAFTGLSALSQNRWDFMFYRFLTGLGVWGEFAAGVTLVAAVMPERARPHAGLDGSKRVYTAWQPGAKMEIPVQARFACGVFDSLPIRYLTAFQ